jgi:uncharacterized protein (DUF2336 family)
MLTPKEHLAYLVELAAEPGAKERCELLRELGELLTAWPKDYPIEARSSFAALLARVEHDVDPENRRELARKLARCPDAPLSLLNEFFFDVPADARGSILKRDCEVPAATARAVDEPALIAAARGKRGAEFANTLASSLGIDVLTAMEILQDTSAMGLAIACRGAGLSRAAFSTFAVLTARSDAQMEARLAAFDSVPEKGAATMLAFWRQQAASHAKAA